MSRLRDQIRRRLQHWNTQVWMMLHFLLESHTTCHLSVIIHNEFQATLLQPLGMKIIRRTEHPRHGINIHVSSNQLMLHHPLQITQLPHIRQVKKTQQLIQSYAVIGRRAGNPRRHFQTFDSIRVQKFQHEPHDFRTEAGFDSNDTLLRFAKSSRLLTSRHAEIFAKEGFEVVGPRGEDAFVGADFDEDGGFVFHVVRGSVAFGVVGRGRRGFSSGRGWRLYR
mmetsp:Transcript_2357/g.5093  ORF Transcript_2357/g.5093 Transcript_2357/m.5093 type:complete len:223 (+) Transcript_2357:397-1065(+)